MSQPSQDTAIQHWCHRGVRQITTAPELGLLIFAGPPHVYGEIDEEGWTPILGDRNLVKFRIEGEKMEVVIRLRNGTDRLKFGLCDSGASS